MYEEMCVNELLPKPFHPEFSKIPHKHPTRVLATALHFLIHKRMFDTKISQAELSQDFAIAEKKLHMAVSGHKYDPGKKPSKRKGEPKDPKEQTEQKKPKMAQQATTTETAWQATETESAQATHIPDTQADVEAEEQLLSDDDDDSLQDPFAPKEMTPKTSNTKEDKSAENVQEEMDTMPELISNDDNDALPKSFSTKDPTGIPKTSHHHPKKFSTKKPPPQPHHK